MRREPLPERIVLSRESDRLGALTERLERVHLLAEYLIVESPQDGHVTDGLHGHGLDLELTAIRRDDLFDGVVTERHPPFSGPSDAVRGRDHESTGDKHTTPAESR